MSHGGRVGCPHCDRDVAGFALPNPTFFGKLACMEKAASTPVRPRTEDEHSSRVLRAVAHLEAHLAGDVGVEELAAVACYSPRHFERVFERVMGEGVREHTRRLRLERAATLLVRFDWSVVEVALACGFESVAAFARAFASHHGCTATQFRAKRSKAAHEGGPPVSFLAVHVEEMPPLRLAFLRHYGRELDAAKVWLRLHSWARQRGLLDKSTKLLGISHDDEGITDDAQRRYDAAITLPEGFQPDGPVGICDLPGGLVAMHRFHGSPAALFARWQLFCDRWLPQSGWKPRLDVSFDLYPAHQLRPWRILRAMMPGGIIESTLCIPVTRHEKECAWR